MKRAEWCSKCDKWVVWDEIETHIPHTDIYYCKDCSNNHPERLNPEDRKVCDSLNTANK